jgi:hypothetical protein
MPLAHIPVTAARAPSANTVTPRTACKSWQHKAIVDASPGLGMSARVPPIFGTPDPAGVALNFQIRHPGVYPLSLTEEPLRLTTLFPKKSETK